MENLDEWNLAMVELGFNPNPAHYKGWQNSTLIRESAKSLGLLGKPLLKSKFEDALPNEDSMAIMRRNVEVALTYPKAR